MCVAFAAHAQKPALQARTMRSFGFPTTDVIFDDAKASKSSGIGCGPSSKIRRGSSFTLNKVGVSSSTSSHPAIEVTGEDLEEVEDEVEDAKDDLSKATLNLFKASIKCPTSSFVTGVLIHLLYRKQVLLSSLKPMASANPNREKPEPECVERWTKQEEQDGPSRTKSRSLPAAQPRCQGRPLKETRGGKKMSKGGGRNCEQTSQKGP